MGRQGNNQQNNIEKIQHLLFWPYRWPSRCTGTLWQASPNEGGSELYEKPLDAVIWQAFAPIASIGHANAGFCIIFHHGGRGKMIAPANNRGMTYQNDEKGISKTIGYLVGGGGGGGG